MTDVVEAGDMMSMLMLMIDRISTTETMLLLKLVMKKSTDGSKRPGDAANYAPAAW